MTRDLSVGRKIGVALAAALLILVVVGVARLRSTTGTVQSGQQVAHALEVVATLEAAIGDLVDLQIGARGFIITGDSAYLDPYRAGLPRLPRDLEALRRLTADNPAQQRRLDRLDSLTSPARAIFARNIEVRRREGFAAAARIVATREGKRTMEAARAVAAEMERAERVLLAQRTATARQEARLARSAAVLGAVVASLTVLGAAWWIGRDLAGRRRSEAALQASEERFRALAASANDSIVSADHHGVITYFNPGAERTFGYAAADVLGQPLTILMPERFHAAHRAGLSRYVTTEEPRVVGRTVELVGRRKDGTEFPVELSLASWKRGTEVAFTGILRDITDRKRAEEALRDNAERLRIILESMTEGLVVADEQGHFTLYNPAAERIAGIGMTDTRPEEWTRTYGVYQPDGHTPVPMDEIPLVRAIRGETTRDVVQFLRNPARPDGVYVNVSGAPLRDAAGRVRGGVVLVSDITERRRVQLEVERLNAELAHQVAELAAVNKELETFSYSVSHDLRAPLRAIDGYSRILVEDHAPALGGEGNRLLGVIRENTARMGYLIDDLLEFSRLSRKELATTRLDMTALARAVAEDLRRAQAKPAVIDIAPLPPAHGDAAMVRQVWENLIGNAVKSSGKRDAPHITIGTVNGAAEPTYFVRDNGVGFDMAYVDKLFRVFQRLHRAADFEGTGVGLAIVQRVVHRHGGRVWAEGAPDRGATFYFTLPAGGSP